MANNGGINVALELQLQNYEKSLAKLTSLTNKTMAKVTKANDAAGNSFKKFDKNAGLATASVMSMGQVMSDLPYGLRGVGNNLQQLAGLMGGLVGKAGSVKAAFKSLVSAFAGPAGVIFVFNSVIAALQMFQEKQRRAKKEVQEATKSINSQAINVKALANVYTSANTPIEERQKAFEQLKKKLPGLTDLEYDNADAIGIVNKATEKYIKLQVIRERSKGVVEDLVKLENELATIQSQAIEGANKGLANSEFMAGIPEHQRKRLELQAEGKLKSEEEIKLEKEIAGLYADLTDLKRIDLSLTEATTGAIDENKKATEDYVAAVGKMAHKIATPLEMINRTGMAVLIDTPKESISVWNELYFKVNEHLDNVVQKVKSVQQGFSAMFGIVEVGQERQMAALTEEHENRKRLIEDNVVDELNKRKMMEQADKDYDKKKRAIERQQAVRAKAQALFEATVNVAEAIAEALPNPLKVAFASLVGAAQIGTIAAQPIPALAEGGLAYAPTLAMVGDNKGARTDPEVIAPLSKLSSIMGGGIHVYGHLQGETIYLQQERVGRRKGRTR